MTREEAIEKLRLFDFIGSNEDEEFLTALEMAIKALEQEPCDDTISRPDLDEIKELMTDISGETVYAVKMSEIRKMPSVYPVDESRESVDERVDERVDDCISRQEVLNAMRKNHRSGGRDIDGDYIEGDYRESLYDDIVSLPSVTPLEKVGRWECN